MIMMDLQEKTYRDSIFIICNEIFVSKGILFYIWLGILVILIFQQNKKMPYVAM